VRSILAKQFSTIVHHICQWLIRNQTNETVHRLDSFSYLIILTDYFKVLSSFSIRLLLQWTHLLNILDYSEEACYSSILSIRTLSSLITDPYLTGQFQSYCHLVSLSRHQRYVEHLTSIIIHRHLCLLFEQSHISTNYYYLCKRNQLLLLLLKIHSLESIDLDESAHLLLILIEQLLTFAYI